MINTRIYDIINSCRTHAQLKNCVNLGENQTSLREKQIIYRFILQKGNELTAKGKSLKTSKI